MTYEMDPVIRAQRRRRFAINQQTVSTDLDTQRSGNHRDGPTRFHELETGRRRFEPVKRKSARGECLCEGPRQVPHLNRRRGGHGPGELREPRHLEVDVARKQRMRSSQYDDEWLVRKRDDFDVVCGG